MKKALIIAFEFPPLASGGVMRCTKYVKYLRNYGWEPVVLTVDESAHSGSLLDHHLLEELPAGISFHRTPYIDFDVLFQRDAQSSALLRIYQTMDAGFPGIFGFAKPDKNITWYPAALEKAKEIISEESIDLVYTDSPPNSTALLGYKLKEIYNIPWIADFRDPWSLDDLAYENMGSSIHESAREMDMVLEKIILEKCDQLIVVSEKLKEKYINRLHIPDNRISVIRDGYDEGDFQDVVPEKEADKEFFNIKYMGSFYGSYNPSVFLKALDHLVTGHGVSDIRFHVIGHGSKWIRQNRDKFNLHRLEPFIKTEEHMDLKQCLSRMLNSDLLLAVSPPEMDYNVPQKIYTYMKLGAPIFAVMPEKGEAASIIREAGAGYIVDSKAVHQVKNKLHELYLSWKQGALSTQSDTAVIAGYDKRHLTGKLAEHFNSRIEHRQTSSEAMNREGERLYEEGKIDEALNVFQQALTLNPRSTETLNNLGVAYFHLNSQDKAISCLIRALEIDPADTNSLINTYQIYSALGFERDAKDILQRIRELSGDNEIERVCSNSFESNFSPSTSF